MNPITQAIAESNVLEALEQSGRIGKYERTTHEIFIDGLMEVTGENAVAYGDFQYVKVSDIVPDMADFAQGTFGVTNAEEKEPLQPVTPIDVGYTFGEDGFVGVVVTKGVPGVAPNGLYLNSDFFGFDQTYVVEWSAKTIHPIDPKFIPGDYVVDLDALGFTADAVVDGVELPVEVGEALKRTASTYGGIVVKLNGSVHRLPNFLSAEGLKEYIWGGVYFIGEIIWISAHFEPADNYFVLVGTPLMSAASEEKLDV